MIILIIESYLARPEGKQRKMYLLTINVMMVEPDDVILKYTNS
jgi:hypothetical protein